MSDDNKRVLTPNQFKFLIVGFIIGTEFISLPNYIGALSKQDAWISSLLGIIYPAYILIIANYIISKNPDNTLFDLNQMYFGKIPGKILNYLFLIGYAIYPSTITSEFTRMLQVNLVSFLSPNKIAILCLIMSFYAASKGLKALGKANEFISYFLFIIIGFSVFALRYGSLYNIMPVCGSGFSNIVKGASKTLYVYSGFELLLLVHPYVKSPEKIKKNSYLALLITSSIWVWTVFITVFYLGPEIVPKTYWSFLFVFSSLNVPVINNFRYIFLIIWMLVGIKIVSNFIYICAYMLNDLTKISYKKLCFYVSLVSFLLFIIFYNIHLKQSFVAVFVPIFIAFNIILITTLGIITLIKFKSNNPQN